MNSSKTTYEEKSDKLQSTEIADYEDANVIKASIKDLENTYNISVTDKNEVQLANHLTHQSMLVNPMDYTQQKQWDNTMTVIKSINPKDKIEAMLASQMTAIYNAAMQTLSRASQLIQSNNATTLAAGNKTFNIASMLMRTYTMQMEALNRHRGKGQQKITVEHVNITDGGKAVIGNITNSAKTDNEIG